MEQVHLFRSCLVSSVRPLAALQLVAQFGELIAAGHLTGELVEGDLTTLLVQDGLAQFQDDEVVADQVGVVRVVGRSEERRVGREGGGRRAECRYDSKRSDTGC